MSSYKVDNRPLDLRERMFFPDTDLVAKKFPEWSERWGREIAR